MTRSKVSVHARVSRPHDEMNYKDSNGINQIGGRKSIYSSPKWCDDVNTYSKLDAQSIRSTSATTVDHEPQDSVRKN